MQIILLAITVILSIILYRMLSSQTATYPYIRTTRISTTEDDAEYMTTEAEQGLITIDHDMVIVEGQEYTLKAIDDYDTPQAYLNIDNGKLLSIGIRFHDGEKQFFIDPEHSLYNNQYHSRLPDQSHHHIFSF